MDTSELRAYVASRLLDLGDVDVINQELEKMSPAKASAVRVHLRIEWKNRRREQAQQQRRLRP